MRGDKVGNIDEAQKALEQALIDLLNAQDSQGRKVRLGGDYNELLKHFNHVRKWFEPPFAFVGGDLEKAAALRNLALLSTAYAAYLEYFAVGGVPLSTIDDVLKGVL
jgi:hypothetical protein